MKEFNIRKASLKDAVTIANVAKLAFYQAFAEHPANSPDDMKAYTDKAFAVETISEDLKDKSVHYFVAELDGEIIGYAKIKQDAKIDCVKANAPIEICRLYLLEEYTGKGFGAKLMQHCLGFAKKNGHDVVWLGVWEYNYRAQKFYQKFGFKRVGEHIFQLGNDPQIDWILQKEIV
jgi:ribosomal protein S18 acetylase RimI-like enzyme